MSHTYSNLSSKIRNYFQNVSIQFKNLVIGNKDIVRTFASFSDYLAAGYKKCINKRKVHKDNNRDKLKYNTK